MNDPNFNNPAEDFDQWIDEINEHLRPNDNLPRGIHTALLSEETLGGSPNNLTRTIKNILPRQMGEFFKAVSTRLVCMCILCTFSYFLLIY